MRLKLLQFGLLFATGAAWGLTNPLAKIAVSTGYEPFGLVFWQLCIVIAMSGAAMLLTKTRLPITRRHLGLYLGVALVGTLIPDYLIYTAAKYIPAGYLAIVSATTPMLSLAVAIALRFEPVSILRASGTLLGLAAVALMVGPQSQSPGAAQAGFVLLALAGMAFYAVQGNFIVWYGLRDAGALQILFGSSVIALIIDIPSTLATGQYVNLFVPWTVVEWGILGTGALHCLAYAGYLAMISRAGPVFASQVAYVITGTGVLWSILLLAETYAIWVWLAFILMIVAIAMVQPRRLPDSDVQA